MFEEDEGKDFEEYLKLFLSLKYKRGKLFVNQKIIIEIFEFLVISFVFFV